jgi:hypothetical protein
MRLLAALQNTTPMVMYPRRTEKKILREPLWAGVLRPSLAASRFFFSDLIHLDDDIGVLLP